MSRARLEILLWQRLIQAGVVLLHHNRIFAFTFKQCLFILHLFKKNLAKKCSEQPLRRPSVGRQVERLLISYCTASV